MAEKLFYSMGEVSEMFDVNPSLLRHWETQFSVIRPKRNKKGNRLYTPQDVENLKLIYHLVKEQGMTLEGAKKALRRRRRDGDVGRDAELLERLQRVRAMLEEVREELKGAGDGIVVGGTDLSASTELSRTPADAAKGSAGRTRAVVRIGADGAPVAEPTDDSSTGSAGAKSRRPRRRKEEAETKELFAFYEQSLF